MKIFYLLIISILFALTVQGQVSKTIEATAGNLSNLLTAEELATVTDLTITGILDARDFKTMRDDMPLLENLDMSQALIVAYEGNEGPSEATTVYGADAIPRDAFHIENYGKPSLLSVQIPISAKVIGAYAFSRCTGLSSFTIPSSVTDIQEGAFATCYTITSFVIPESVETIGKLAFAACNGLLSFTIPSKVDSIQASTFASCYAINSIEIPSTLTYIGEEAFYSCGALETILLPSSLKTLGDLAFYQCTALKSITLPGSLTHIGKDAFNGCSSLEGKVTLPEGLTIIEKNTFQDCIKLTSVEIPSSVDSIGDAAFLRCSALESINFPSSIVFIGNSAFSECIGLTGTLTLPPSLKVINYNAFEDCSKLTGELVIPSEVTTIETQAFTHCSSLTSLVIPSSVTTIEDDAFSFCRGLTSIEVHHLFPLSINTYVDVFAGIDKSAVTLHVPYGTKERYATAYGWKDFKTIIEDTQGFQLNVTSIKFMPEGGNDQTIELTADFAWTASSDQSWLTVSPPSGDNSQTLVITAEANSSLSSRKGVITLSADGITSQTIQVSQLSEALTVPVTPGSLSQVLSVEEKQSVSSLILTGSMDARDFKTIHDQMPSLEILDIREISIVAFTDTTYGNHLLHGADVIPFAVFEWIDERQTSYALSGHPRLASVKLPASLKAIGYRAFFGCSSLTDVELQSAVTGIGNEAFSTCGALTNINLPSSVTDIGEKAFQYCGNLPAIELPSALEAIKFSTFEGCRALKTIVIPSSVTTIESNAFTSCSSLQSVVLPPAITTIAYEVFKDCNSLISIVIPPMVTLIKEFAFWGCSSLQTLTLPASLTAIEPAAFSDCISLDTIYSFAVNPPDIDNPGGWDVFDKVDKSNCVLYVPKGTKDEYAAAFGWKEFKTIVEMDEFSLESTTVTLEAEANSMATVKLHSSLSWTATSNQEWLTVSPQSGTGGQLLTFTAQANSSDSSRTAIVRVIAAGVDTLTLNITQHAHATGVELMGSLGTLKYYPNPFTQHMTIEVSNPSYKAVSVDIYNMTGQRIKSLVRAQKEANIKLTWDGSDESGEKVIPGIYLLKMNEMTKKVVLQ